jgi:hypothetical protein
MTIRYSPARPPGAPDTPRGDDWRDSAACAGHWDTFWAAMPYQPYGAPQDDAAQAEALAICATCPVREACRAELDPADDPWHVSGGTTPRQRQTARLAKTEPTIDGHACPDCGQASSTTVGLAIHRGKAHPPAHECTECPRRYRTERGLSIHWSQAHAADVGRCIRGHDYAPGVGRCRECVRESSAAHRAKQTEAAA